MEIKEGVFARIGQTFVLFKNNFLELFLPLFLYKLLSVVVFGTILMSIFFGSLLGVIDGTLDFFTFLNNPYVVTSIVIGTILLIVYLILYIPVFLGLIKSIKQASEGNKITTIDNLKFGFSRILSSFKTYWYIFAYIALIPSIFFILGGILFNVGFYIDGVDWLSQIGGLFMIVGGILFLVFTIYRGIKASFPLYSAVDHDNFEKNDFLNSIAITNNNWLRIVGNFLLIGFIVSLLSGLIGVMISFVSYSGIDFESIKSVDDIIEIATNFSVYSQFISSFINNIIKTIGTVFVIVFTFIFYLRLSFESTNLSEKVKD